MNNCLENKTAYVFDLETNGLYNDVNEIYCLVIYNIERKLTTTYGPESITAGIEHLAKADILIGHNIIFYDIPVLQKLYSFVSKAHIIDTLVCTRLIWPKELLLEKDNNADYDIPPKLRGSASLKAWGYRLLDNKIDFKDFSAYSEEMAAYCRQDVQVTYKLFNYIQKQNYSQIALNLEHNFAKAINNQIIEGFPFDIDKSLDLVDNLRQKKEELDKTLQEMFPPILIESIFIPKTNNKKHGFVKGIPFVKQIEQKFNPGSRQQILERLHNKYSWVPEKMTSKGNPIINDDVLENLSFPEAKTLVEYQLIKKRLGQIVDGQNAWLKLFNKNDNKIHGDVITNGCITGRCSHRNPNMAQVPGVYSPYGKECRTLFYAPKGYLLMGVDAKALELRCLAGYLARWDQGKYASLVVDPKVDIHIFNQEQFGVSSRDISKRLLYCMLYGGGAVKSGSIIDPNEKNESILRELGSAAINSFLKNVPALKSLKKQINDCLLERDYLIGLDNRQLHCRSAFKGLNVLLQSAGAILMKQVVINLNTAINKLGLIYGKDWMQLAMIHDEIQLACLPEHKDLVMAQALEAFPAAQKFFNFTCKIEGEAKIGYTWADTH
jgi:DNA polymerase I-like protein with 3'-5' exonuclease and polymerase domains